MKKMLMLASVASMIDQFNLPNIQLLQSMGYHVDVACNFQRGNTCPREKVRELRIKLKQMGVNCYQIDFAREVTNIFSNFKAYWQVEYIMRQNQYDFVHCHSPIGGVAGRLAGKKNKLKVIYTAHGFHFYKGAPMKNWLIYYPIEKLCSYLTDTLITINREDYRLARKKMHPKYVEYVPGVGIDITKFGRTDEASEELRKELKIPQKAIWLLSVGELNSNKNHVSVIRAIADMPDVYYTIAGQGALKGYLENEAKKLGAENRVKLLGFCSYISDLYEAADIFVLPSFREGLSAALLEAMAAAKPIACSNIRGNTDVIDNSGGCLFEASNVDDIKASLNFLAALPVEERLKLGSYNLNKIQHFDKDTIQKAMMGIYGGGGGSTSESSHLQNIDSRAVNV